MADTELLRSVVPQEDGWYCVVGLMDGKPPIQTFHKTLHEVEQEADRLVAYKRNAFFGCGMFKTEDSREADNCGWMQSFFLDIDCGPTKAAPDKYGRIKGYIDQATGMQAVKDLCKGLNLPKPTIVDSGRGWHVYWPLTESVEASKWLPVAHTFKARCKELNIIIDPDVPADAARVLRIPGTKNFKDDPAHDVVLMPVMCTVPRYGLYPSSRLAGTPTNSHYRQTRLIRRGYSSSCQCRRIHLFSVEVVPYRHPTYSGISGRMSTFHNLSGRQHHL